MKLVAIHSFAGGSRHLFSSIDFMVDLRRHASTDTAKDHIGDHIDNPCQLIVSFAIGEHADASQETTADLQAIGASNETDVVFVQPESVFRTHDIGRGGDGESGTTKGFERHATARAGCVAHLPRLEAAAPPKLSLTASVVLPPAIRRNMIQGLVA
jgi:hypothetical protein